MSKGHSRNKDLTRQQRTNVAKLESFRRVHKMEMRLKKIAIALFLPTSSLSADRTYQMEPAKKKKKLEWESHL